MTVEFIGSKKIDVSSMITYKVKLSEGSEIFEKIIEEPQGYGKVLLFPEWDKE